MDISAIDFVIYGLPLLIAIPFHEAAHGFVAHRCGDPTAYEQGRVTFNPVKHVDPLGTIGFPALLILMKAPFVFGWAKPVPVDFRRLRNLRRDMVLVAIAGPVVNILLALLSAVFLRFALAGIDPGLQAELPWYAQMLFFSLLLNVALAVFNMLPLLPLDGGRVLTGLLPPRLAIAFARTEKFGFPLLLAILFVPPLLGRVLGQDWNLFTAVLFPPIMGMVEVLLMLVGLG